MQPPTTTEQALIKQAQGGDAAAFEALLNKYYNTIYRFAYRWCGNATEAEDIAQNACIKLAASIKSFRFESAFSSWLYRLVINCAKDWARSQKHFQNQVEPVETEEPNYSPQPEHNVLLTQILKLLGELAEGFKEAVLLVHGEGLTHAEAANVLQIKESTVSWRLHEVRKHLQLLNLQEP